MEPIELKCSKEVWEHLVENTMVKASEKGWYAIRNGNTVSIMYNHKVAKYVWKGA